MREGVIVKGRIQWGEPLLPQANSFDGITRIRHSMFVAFHSMSDQLNQFLNSGHSFSFENAVEHLKHLVDIFMSVANQIKVDFNFLEDS